MASLARQQARPATVAQSASSAFDFEMPAYTSHTARRSPPRSKPTASSPSRASPRRSNNINTGARPTASSDRALLDMLRSTVACLREKCMDVEALGCLEQGLWLQRRMLGADNPQVRAALEEVVLGLNALAMQFLSASSAFDQCLALLRKAEAITAPGNFSAKATASLQVLTLNNLGCCYRKLGKPRTALRYLQEAARIGGAIGEAGDKTSKEATTVVLNLSVTHLNLCAIQSQLGRHELALEHAQAAIFHAQDELVRMEEDGGGRGRRLDDGAREEKLVALAVAYHNLAVELEFNGRGDASLQWFRKALELAGRYRERNSALCASFQRALDDAKRKYGPSRPKSAATSRPGSRPVQSRPSRARERATDVSYQATVASKCYRPLRPAASSSNACRSPPTAAPSGQSGRRQRPVSASSSSSRARQTTSGRLYGSNSTARFAREQEKEDEPALDRHWRKLEQQYDLDKGSSDHLGSPNRRPVGSSSAWRADGSSQCADQQRRRPLSASAASARPRVADSRLETHGQEEDDCGVFEDDAPSDDETRGEGQDRSSPSKTRQSGRRHQEALSYSRSTTSCASESDDEDNREPGDVSSGYAGEDDDPDLPRQRVSHMAYLRRMKKLAESIRDDMGESPSKRVSGGVDSGGKTSARATKGTDPPREGREGEEVETPRRASLSKMRAKLERMRSDSLLSLLDKREEGGVEANIDGKGTERERQLHSNPAGHITGPQVIQQENGVPDPAAAVASRPTFLLEEDANVFVTSAQVCEGELALVQSAATGLLQRFYRGSSCRLRLQRTKREEEQQAAARVIQRQIRRHRDRYGDCEADREDREMLLLQRQEVRGMAASVIQQLYWSRRLSRPGVSGLPPSSVIKTRNYNEQPPKADDTAARRLQRAVRRLLTRRRVQRSQARRLSRQYIERKHFDVSLAHAMRKEQEFLEQLSATKIQALVRGRQCRALTESEFVGLHAAASRIQGSFRTHRRCCSIAASVGARSIAARVVQRAFRSFRWRCDREERDDVEHIAAAAIQRFWLQRHQERGEQPAVMYEYEEFDEDLDEAQLAQEEAATCIQALSRGHLARKSLQSLRSSVASLTGSASAQSRPALHDQTADEDEVLIPDGRSVGGNASFLPRRVRELFLQSLEQPTALRLAEEEDGLRSSQLMATGSARERFNALLRELEAAGVADDTMGRTLEDMRVLVVNAEDGPVSMPAVVQLARLVDLRLGSEDYGDVRGLQEAAMALLFALRGALDATA